MRRSLVLMITMALYSCQPAQEQGHSHEETGSHGHAHGTESTLSHTLFTERLELFVDFSTLVVGKKSRFASYFTILDGHQPVTEGTLTISLIKGNKGIRQRVEAPSSPGLFRPVLQPQEAGNYQLVFDLSTPAFAERLIIRDIQVYATQQAATAVATSGQAADVITFGKEQAWKMDFQTAVAQKKKVYEVIPAYGTWQTAPAEALRLIAPAAGRILYSLPALQEGSPVAKGQLLMTVGGGELTANNLNSEVQKAEARYTLAKARYERQRELLKDRIVSRVEYEQAEEAYRLAQTNYEALVQNYSAGAKAIKAPADGHVRAVFKTNGDFAREGDPLLTLATGRHSNLSIQVGSEHGAALQNIQDIWYKKGDDSWSGMRENGGKVLSVSREVSAEQPSLIVFASLRTSDPGPAGSFTEVALAVGQGEDQVTVPVSALLEDYGVYSVIVQLSGESYERRVVQVGPGNGSDQVILAGLSPGEVVVSKGAYQVKMASMQGQAPAHGHAH